MASTRAESQFLRFCNDVADESAPLLGALSQGAGAASPAAPYWLKNLSQFEKIFVKYRIHGNSHLPIKAFINANREILEAPVATGTDPNDRWLLFPDDLPEPSAPGLVPVKPRGVYLSMKEGADGYIRSIPLSEVYAACLNIASRAEETPEFLGVASETLPGKFLLLFYEMLLEVEPENTHFQNNVETADSMVVEAGSAQGVAFDPSNLTDMLGGLLRSDGGRQISSMLTGVLSSVNPEAGRAFGDFATDGDPSKLMSAAAPLMQSLQGMMAGLSSSGTMAAPAAGESVEASAVPAIEDGASDQE